MFSKDQAQKPISSILASVIDGGTGRSGKGKLRLGEMGSEGKRLGIRLWAGGKTGTTNDYRNGAFVGYIMGPGKMSARGLTGFTWDAGVTLAAYAGFDDNRPMVAKGTRGAGGVVALPVWAEMAAWVAKILGYEERVDAFDLIAETTGKVPPLNPEAFEMFVVDAGSGLPFKNERGEMLKFPLLSLELDGGKSWVEEKLGLEKMTANQITWELFPLKRTTNKNEKKVLKKFTNETYHYDSKNKSLLHEALS